MQNPAPKQLTTSITPLNPTPEEARIFHLILIALSAARQLDAAPLALETDSYEGIAVTMCEGELVLYETTTQARSLRAGAEGEEVPAWGVARLMHFRGDRETPPDSDYEELLVKRGLGEAITELVCEVVRDSINGALCYEAERQMQEEEEAAWPEPGELEELTGDAAINYEMSDRLADEARERKYFGRGIR